MPAHEGLFGAAAVRFRRVRWGLTLLRASVLALVLLLLFTVGVLRT